MSAPPPVGSAAPSVRRGARVPGTRQEWVTVSAQVHGLLVGLRTAERHGGATLPEPLGGGCALRAWARVVRAVLDRRDVDNNDSDIAVAATDLRVLDDAAVALGRALCRWRARGAGSAVSDLLRSDAAVYHLTPESLVAQVARVHGVLTSDDPDTARLLWRAGAV